MIAILLLIAGGACVIWAPLVGAAIGYALCWLGLKRISRGRFFVATIWGASVLAVQFAWFATPHYHGAFIILAYVLICLCMGLLWGGFCQLVIKKSVHVIALASLWTLVEWGKLHLFCGFAFHQVGMALASTIYGRSLASIAGVLGLTFWVALTNLLFMNDKKKWIIAACLPYLLGVAHVLYYDQKIKIAPTKRALLIQTGLFPEQKSPMMRDLFAFVAPLDQWQRIFDLIAPADYIVLPEAALPFGARTQLFMQDQVEQLFKKALPYRGLWSHLDIATELAMHMDAEVMIGLDDNDEKKNYNAAFHITPQGRVTRFEKRQLLPIAEAIPFEWLRPFAATYGIDDFFTPGDGNGICGEKEPLTMSICYDECFGSLVRKVGLRLHVNLSNDAWYPHSSLNRVHFEHGRLRAVENGIPMLRACNTGISAIIDSLGRTVVSMDTEESGAIIGDVPMFTYPTLYNYFGDIPLLSFCFIIVPIFVLRCSKKARSAKVGNIA